MSTERDAIEREIAAELGCEIRPVGKLTWLYNVYRMNEQFTINRELGDSEKQLGLGIVWDALVDARLSASLKLAAADRLAEALERYQASMREQYEPSTTEPCSDCNDSGKCAWCDLYKTAAAALLEYSRTKV